MDGLIDFATLKDWGPGTFVVFICLMILTGQLKLKRDFKEVERQRDEWQRLALSMLGVTKTQVEANEQATRIIDKRLPTPEVVTEIVKQVNPEPGGDQR